MERLPAGIPAMRTTVKNSKGFTLIELIIVIIIAGIGIVPLINMFYGAGLSMGQSDFITLATELAQKKMDDNTQLGFSAIPEDAGGTFPAPHAAYSYTTTVTLVNANFLDDASSTTYKKLVVTVTSAGRNVTLTTVLSNHS